MTRLLTILAALSLLAACSEPSKDWREDFPYDVPVDLVEINLNIIKSIYKK